MSRRPFIVLDVEATQTVKTAICRADLALVYDLGWIVTDGETVFERRSFIISDVFYSPYMENAYYADKLPQYYVAADLIDGDWVMINFAGARRQFFADCVAYGVKDVWAYNCRYDRMALNNTVKTLSNEFVTDFFPADVSIRDIWGAAGTTICNTKKYVRWCMDNNYLTEKGNPITNAEIVYSYLIQDDFVEDHTALADCEIELDILNAALKRKQKMDTREMQGWRAPSKIMRQII